MATMMSTGLIHPIIIIDVMIGWIIRALAVQSWLIVNLCRRRSRRGTAGVDALKSRPRSGITGHHHQAASANHRQTNECKTYVHEADLCLWR